MAVNLTGPRDGRGGSPRHWVQTRSTARGPQVAFFTVVLIGFGGWTICRATLPADLVMPLVASLFLVFATVFGLVACRRRMDPSGVTYRDVAGALTLIGICAAATIESEQMIRLVQANSTE